MSFRRYCLAIRSASGSVDELLAQAGWLNRLARQLVRDRDLAEDAAQDAWISATRSPPQPGRPVRPWLAEVLRNVIRMRARGERRRARRESAGVDPLETGVASPEAVQERLELHRIVVECVLALEEPLRATVLLHFFEERSSADIARLTGVPAGTVRPRLKRAIERLRLELDGRFGGERHRWALLLAPAAGTFRLAGAAKAAWVITRLEASPAAFVALALGLLAGGVWTAAAVVRTSAPGKQLAAGPGARPVTAVRSGGFSQGTAPGAASRSAEGPRGTGAPVARERGAAWEPGPNAGGLLLSGRVLDAGGGVISGASVKALLVRSRHPPSTNTVRAQTDEAGEYRLRVRAGTHQLYVQASGYAPDLSFLTLKDDRTHDFALTPAARVSVRVFERASGRPLAGAEVLLAADPSDGAGPTSAPPAYTDEAGRFLFDSVGAGRYQLSARRGRLVSIPREVIVHAADSAEMDIAVDPAGSVSGRVLDEQGRPVAGAIVYSSVDRRRCGQPTAR